MKHDSFEGKSLLITGGTGSLGKVLVRRVLSGEMGQPRKVIVLSRDEAKQHSMRMEYHNQVAATDEVIYRNFQRTLEFRIGDVRDPERVASAVRDSDIVVNAAAMKQVPTCEYFPFEAVRTNIAGAENIVKAIRLHKLPVETVVGVSTDKACKPTNAMGMTKALQERIFIQGNMRCPGTRFVVSRYGNVLASRGSVVPLFHEQIRRGGPVTVTAREMTRFLLSLDDAVDTLFAVIRGGEPGDTYVPRAPSSSIVNVARALIGDRNIEICFNGIRPGEKIHEIMISEEESHRVRECGNWFAIAPMLPEVAGGKTGDGCLSGEYSSKDNVMSLDETIGLLRKRQLMLNQVAFSDQAELLR